VKRRYPCPGCGMRANRASPKSLCMSCHEERFYAADYAAVMDPVMLAGERTKQRARANNIAVGRLKEAHSEEWALLLAEERTAADQRFRRWLAVKAGKVARERGAA
jgi:hypothetical protein